LGTIPEGQDSTSTPKTWKPSRAKILFSPGAKVRVCRTTLAAFHLSAFLHVEIVNRNWEPFPKGRIQQVPRKDNAAEDSCKLNQGDCRAPGSRQEQKSCFHLVLRLECVVLPLPLFTNGIAKVTFEVIAAKGVDIRNAEGHGTTVFAMLVLSRQEQKSCFHLVLRLECVVLPLPLFTFLHSCITSWLPSMPSATA
jgi:hypothetical protein